MTGGRCEAQGAARSSWAASEMRRDSCQGPADELHPDRQARVGPVQWEAHRRETGHVAEGRERDARDDIEHRLVGGGVLRLQDRAGHGRQDRRGGRHQDVEVAAPPHELAPTQKLQ